MGDILKSWLAQTTGLNVSLKPEMLGDQIRDGRLISQILFKKGIIASRELDSITPSKNFKVCLSNMNKIRVWLNLIGIECATEFVRKVVEGSGTACLQLLYVLFLSFEGHDRVRLVTKESGRLRETMFLEVPEPAMKRSKVQTHSVNWYLEKRQMFANKCSVARHKIETRLMLGDPRARRVFKEAETLATQAAIKDYEKKHNIKAVSTETALAQLLEKQLNIPDLPYCDSHEEIDTKIFMKNIKKREKDKLLCSKLKQHVEKMSLQEMWDKVIEKRQQEIDYSAAKKLLQQSQFEKQLAQKLFKNRQLKLDLIEKRISEQRLLDEQRNEDFVTELLLEEKYGESIEELNEEERREQRLHELLREKRRKLTHEENYAFCRDVASELIDFAVHVSQFKATTSDNKIPPEKREQWVRLFLHGEPVYHELEPKRVDSAEMFSSLLESLKMTDKERDIAVKYSIDEYLAHLGPWQIPGKNHVSENTVFAHIVYRLLDIKYPPPPAPVSADIPQVSLKGFLLGVDDERSIKALQEILLTKKVHLITLSKFVAKSFHAFKYEFGKHLEVDSKPFQDNRFPIDDFVEKTGKKGTGTPNTAKAPKTANESKKDGRARMDDKMVQVPSDALLVELTPLAKLGRAAFNRLRTGEILDDQFLVDILIEYLKTIHHAKGWVLLNFPLHWNQAKLLEEAFTGQILVAPTFQQVVNEDDTITRSSSYAVPIFINESGDEFVNPTESQAKAALGETSEQEVDIKVSRLLQNPHPVPSEEHYVSFFTKCIEVTKNETDLERRNKRKVYNIMVSEETPGVLEKSTGDTKNSEHVIREHSATKSFPSHEIPSKESMTSHEFLQDFYDEQNTYQLLCYNPYDFQFIKKLLKILLVDVVSDVAHLDNIEDPTAPTAKKGKGTADKKGAEKPTKETRGKDMDIAMATLPVFAELEVQKSYPEIEVSAKRVPMPGDPNWEYVDFPLSYELGSMLATSWQMAESLYLQELTQFFSKKQPQFLKVETWIRHIRIRFTQFLHRPDKNQSILEKFQAEFRDHISECTAQKDCLWKRANNLQNVLWEECDMKKLESEDKVKSIINEGWIIDEMATFTNMHIRLMQMEIYLCTEILQTLYDYYSLMLGKFLHPRKLEKVIIPKIDFCEDKQQNLVDPYLDEVKKRCKIVDYETEIVENIDVDHVRADMRKILTGQYDVSVSSCHKAILKAYEIAMAAKEKLQKQFDDLIDDAENEIVENKKKKIKIRRCYSNLFKSGILKDLDQPLTEDTIRKNCREWRVSGENEFSRITYTLEAIQHRATEDLSTMMHQIQFLFLTLFDDTNKMYLKEISSVDLLCDVVFSFIEQKCPLEGDLVLEGGDFYIRSSDITYPTLGFHLGTGDRKQGTEFGVEQILLLHNMLFHIAPFGYISFKGLQYVIEDIILFWDDEELQLLPGTWKNLNPRQLTSVLTEIFGSSEHLFWNDLLIYAINISYPTQRELLKMLKRFWMIDEERTGLVSCDDYKQVQFWFEKNKLNECENVAWDIIRKELLCEIFQDHGGRVNYMNLLLAFCKSHDPVQGFANALATKLGQSVDLYPSGSEEDGIEVTSEVPVTTALYPVVEDSDEEICDEVKRERHVRESVSILLAPKSSFKTDETGNLTPLPAESRSFTITSGGFASQIMEHQIIEGPANVEELFEAKTEEILVKDIAFEELETMSVLKQENEAEEEEYGEEEEEIGEEEEELGEEEEILEAVKSSKSWLFKASEIPKEILIDLLPSCFPWIDRNIIQHELQLVYDEQEILPVNTILDFSFFNDLIANTNKFKILNIEDVLNKVKKSSCCYCNCENL